MFSPRAAATLLLLSALCLPVALHAQQLDAPTVNILARGHGKLVVEVTAGPSGAPEGFALYWMRRADFDAVGAEWPSDPASPGLKWAFCTGTPTLNPAGATSFRLAPLQTVRIEVGDLALETGLTTNSPGELGDGASTPVEWTLSAYALHMSGDGRGELSNTVSAENTQSTNCTFTQGYWKTHPEAWPVAGLTLGSVGYTQAELLAILDTAVKGNGLVSLAHQLIAAKLNLASGAAPGGVDLVVAAADALVGGLVVPAVGFGSLASAATSGLTQDLDDFNNGISGPGHCGSVPVRPESWGRLKTLYR